MRTLHLLTAVTRPENLPAIATSISIASLPSWEVVWHLMFDPNHEHVGGHFLKNDMLDRIDDGWCLILDDDTLLHPDLIKTLDEVLKDKPETKAVVVDQDGVLFARRDNIRVGAIDAGQVIARRDLIGDNRLPLVYEGDGHFFVSFLPQEENVVFISETLSNHNLLRR